MATAGRLISVNCLKIEICENYLAGFAIGDSVGLAKVGMARRRVWPAALCRQSHVTRAAFGVSILTLSRPDLKLFLKSIA